MDILYLLKECIEIVKVYMGVNKWFWFERNMENIIL